MKWTITTISEAAELMNVKGRYTIADRVAAILALIEEPPHDPR